MNKKKSLLLNILVIVAICVFSFAFFRAFYYIPSDEVPLGLGNVFAEKVLAESEEASSLDSSSYPVSLVIPKIKVDSKIKKVGITRKGNMAAPNNFVDVGWYKYGVIPGEQGSAVIAGHLDNGVALPGVFYNLKDLKKGDDIYVKTHDNKELHFVVTKTERYEFNAIAPLVFTENSGKFLKLITCTGNWVSQYKTHDKRLVVSAELV